ARRSPPGESSTRVWPWAQYRKSPEIRQRSREETTEGKSLPARRPRLRHRRGLGLQVIPVHPGDEINRDSLRADGLALGVVGAGSEAFLLHGLDHREGTVVALGLPLGEHVEVEDLRRGEELRRAVGTLGDAGAAAD